MNLFKQIISYSFIIVVVAFSGGISISQHFCADKLKSTVVNSTSQGCMNDVSDPCGDGINKASCCSSKVSFFETFDYEQEKISKSLNVFNVPPVREFNFQKIFSAFLLVQNHNIPPPKYPIYIKIERFLI